MSYENCEENEQDISPLYHNADLHNFPSPESYQAPFLTSLSPTCQVPLVQEETETPVPIPSPPQIPMKLKKRAIPPDPNDVPRFPINEYEYYEEIEQLLLNEVFIPGVSENYKGHLRKRAQHYLVMPLSMSKINVENLLNMLSVIRSIT